MNNILFSGVSAFLIFIALPIHIQKNFVKALITGGNKTVIKNGQTILTARFGGYQIHRNTIPKTRLEKWQYMHIGAMMGTFLAATITSTP